jgi:hypothetical protein
VIACISACFTQHERPCCCLWIFRREDRPDHRDTGSAGRTYLTHAIGRDSTDRENRDGHRRRGTRQGAKTERRTVGALRGSIEHRPEDNEIRSGPFRRYDLLRSVCRDAYDSARSEQGPRVANLEGACREVHPIGITGDCNVDAVVDQKSSIVSRRHLA